MLIFGKMDTNLESLLFFRKWLKKAWRSFQKKLSMYQDVRILLFDHQRINQ
ncbi:hypothetical protein [Oceanobacillus senegalensis]|uniref:hypothetical protein n=1 Tax=Oceanobacillus senegalensis TaxID=1936063 RepID=UPI001C4F3640|nr:hypothetical protein [Oceanobacillus senegalensis]